MRLTRRLSLPCANAAFGFALGMGFMAVPAAHAQSKEESVPLDTQIVRGILEGIGLERADKRDTINYQERPPLVLPPNGDLPAPISTDLAAKNPAWPKDPDVEERKREAARQRNRPWGGDDYEKESRALGPKEIDIGASNPEAMARARRRAEPGGPGAGEVKDRLTPSELGYQPGNLFKRMFNGKDEVVRFTGEPPRSDLTEPPPGYQTPSPDQPYGTGKAAQTGPSQDNYTTRGEVQSGN